MSEDIKKEFLENVQCLASLWCNKAISTPDLLELFGQAVEVTEKKAEKDFSSFANGL